MASWSSRAAIATLVLGAALVPLAALAADKAETQARQLAKEGQQHYDLGEFDKALEKFSEAYKLKNAPALLFNLAQCHRKLGNWEQSAFFFGRFIDNSNPNAPNIEVARELLEDARRKQTAAEEEARLADERKREDEKRAAAEEERRREEEAEARRAAERALLVSLAPPPPPVVVEEPVTKKPLFWVLLVGGLAAVGGGTAAVVVAMTSPRPPLQLQPASLGEVTVK